MHTIPNKTDALTGLLKRIETGDNLKGLCDEAKELAQQVAPEDIAQAEQTLIDNGYAIQVAHQLSTVFLFMGMYDKQDEKLGNQLPDNHILRRIMVEHDLYRCFNADLRDATEAILQQETLSDVSTEFRNLVDVVRHLQSLDEHIARESDVLFPYIRQRGYAPLTRTAEQDHELIRRHMENLLAQNFSCGSVPLHSSSVLSWKNIWPSRTDCSTPCP